MARKSLQELPGIANAIARSSPKANEKLTKSAAPALGALQGSLAAIREIEPELIDDWGPTDRLEEFTAVNAEDEGESYTSLKESIREMGQQVPILVRRSRSEGRFEAIYGRRRIKACRELDLKVRANVQDMDDATALLAKGLENAARRNLSFYEKARFAEAIVHAGHSSETVRQVLNVSAAGLSHLKKVSQNVPSKIGDKIGIAQKSGRPKWTVLAEHFQSQKLTEKSALEVLSKVSSSASSDERLEFLLKHASKREARPNAGTSETSPIDGVTIKSNRGSLSISVQKTGASSNFANWLDNHIEDIIKKSYAEFTAVNQVDEN